MANNSVNDPSCTKQDDGIPITELVASSSRSDDHKYPQGCSFSPDGLCILTSVHQELQLFNTVADGSELLPALKCSTGETVRSYQWYSFMNSSNPATCCFVSSSRDQPVHLWDAYSGEIRATYRPYNALDEMESPCVVSFSNSGQHIWTGGFRTDRTLHLFDVSRPGRSSTMIQLGKTRRSKDGQKGMVSAMAAAPYGSAFHNVLGVGTYSPGSIYLYDDRATKSEIGSVVMYGHGNGGRSASCLSTCVVGHGKSHRRKKRKHPQTPTNEHDDDESEDDLFASSSDGFSFSNAKMKWFQSRAQLGVTQLKFNQDSAVLYSLSRRSNAVLAWDMRKLGTNGSVPGIQSYKIENDTNQRIEFDVHEGKVWVGGTDGTVRAYDEITGEKVVTVEASKNNVAAESSPQELFGDSTQTTDTSNNTINGVSVIASSSPIPSTADHNTSASTVMIAVTDGCRQFPTDGDFDNDLINGNDLHTNMKKRETGSLRLFRSRIRPVSGAL